MKEKLLEAKFQLEMQIKRLDESIKFLDEHPEMEHILNAMVALTGMVGRF